MCVTFMFVSLKALAAVVDNYGDVVQSIFYSELKASVVPHSFIYILNGN